MTTTAFLNRRPPPRKPDVRAAPPRAFTRSIRNALQAGTMPNRHAAARAMASVNSNTLGSMRIVSSRGRFAGAIDNSSRMPIHASATPPAAPSAVSTTRLRQHLPNDAPATGAERGADGELGLPERRAHEEQVRHVRARDEQQEDHRAHQRQDRRPYFIDERLVHRLEPGVEAGALGHRELLANAGRDRVGLLLRARERDAGLQPADRPQTEGVSVGVVVVETVGDPEVRPLLHVGARREEQFEPGCEDAHDLRARAAGNTLTEHRWIPAVPPLPVFMTQDGHDRQRRRPLRGGCAACLRILRRRLRDAVGLFEVAAERDRRAHQHGRS